MGAYESLYWEGNLGASSTRDRQSGLFRAYLPDIVSGTIAVSPEISAKAASCEQKLRAVSQGYETTGLEAIARLILRSEAVASSKIEGLQVGAKQLAIAELMSDDSFDSHSGRSTARDIINNIRALAFATTQLSELSHTSITDLEDIQRTLVAQASLQGIRTHQNWVGGSSYHPLDADFVPPPAASVENLLTDLLQYLDGAEHGALIQAGLVHAQFETIHAFPDGNGRLGRALIHTVLMRRGLQKAAFMPISVALHTRSNEYVAGLTAFRHLASAGTREAREGINYWLDVFLAACDVALTHGELMLGDIRRLTRQWKEQHEEHYGRTHTRRIRSDAASVRLRNGLVERPVFTKDSAQEYLDVNDQSTKNAISELEDAQIVRRINIGPGLHGWYQPELFDLINEGERALASTQWNTVLSPPSRAVPAPPTKR